ncbi:Acyltransferase family protein [Algoriella xinjiangensis]|uniref:Acyltransferase family protein n=1 Tax=Algoriella xinjiangensis TaxID=684065 RepID=A0A1I4U8L2_9FLAO|nr:acyltransferase family protein [Algoriella xinjiangensis]SFM85304.1 Acyltransferase family protein [Algoriella xinjiangensis]VDH17912.1 Glucans biosynthesis protein C [Algoriella xinjiangensis]
MKISQRLVGLDLLRAILMLIGPIYHISYLFETNSNLINTNNNFIYDLFSITHPFRMEVFFLLSGFFASFLIEQKGITFFKKNRVQKIYIPLLFSILIILPITIKLYYINQNSYQINSQHIWFLISLALVFIPYSFFYKLIKKVVLYTTSFSLLKILIISLFYASLTYALSKVSYELSKISSPEIHEIVYTFLINPINSFLPTFLGSVLYYKSYNINKKFNLPIIIAFLIIHSIFSSPVLETLKNIYKIPLRGIYFITTFYLILIIYNYFKNLKINNSERLKFFVNASFTIYLIHQPLVYFNGLFMNKLISNDYTEFMFINILTYSQCFILYYIISNLKIGRYLFGIKTAENISFLKSSKYFTFK